MPSALVILFAAVASTSCLLAAGVFLSRRVRRRRTLTQEQCAATLEAAIGRSGRRVGVPTEPPLRPRGSRAAGGKRRPRGQEHAEPQSAPDYDTL